MCKRITLVVVVSALALGGALAACNKVTGGGEMTCIGEGEELCVWVYGGGGTGMVMCSTVEGGVEGDRCTFGLTAQPDKEPDTAKGQIQFVDHTGDIKLHCQITDETYAYSNPVCAEYEARWEEGGQSPGRITVNGTKYPVDYVHIYATSGEWWLNNAGGETIDEGCGDALILTVEYNDGSDDQLIEWVGVVENGNITIHEDKE